VGSLTAWQVDSCFDSAAAGNWEFVVAEAAHTHSDHSTGSSRGDDDAVEVGRRRRSRQDPGDH